ncbi:hypothetical protein RYX36_022543 [Vicia faba]
MPQVAQMMTTYRASLLNHHQVYKPSCLPLIHDSYLEKQNNSYEVPPTFRSASTFCKRTDLPPHNRNNNQQQIPTTCIWFLCFRSKCEEERKPLITNRPILHGFHLQNWLAQQPEPVGYDLGHAVGSSYESSAPSAWNATWPPQIYGNETTTMLPNQPEFIQALRCEVCKIDVNSKDSYEKHVAGKKHQKNLQNGACCIQVQALIGPVVNQSKDEKQVEQSKVCTTCNVLCTGHDTYIKHIAGKKHAAQVCLMSNGGIGPSIAEFKRIGVPPFQKAAKKIKVAQSAWCETCKINCNSRDMYITHLAGKKHLKNLEKLSNPKIDVGTSSTANASNTLIGPREKPGTDNPKAKKASISLHLTSPAQIRHQL